MSPLGFVLTMGIAVYLPVILLLPLYNYFPDGYIIETPDKESLVFDIILFVFIAPFVETLLFQWAIITLLRKLFKLDNTLLVFLSALIFGLVHTPFVTQCMAFLSGLLLAYAFIIYENKRFPAIWMVTLLHVIRNLPIAFLE